ncbi:LysM peptidoglycan-binding domain-containing protein [Desulfopila sp. IMCC35008]|uniref:LysM peptidoglycan-binding domain-containing protein n=1 Tax=Desulfopila sp. IMCC35008 TaxID=2653858 RepID=UPI0013D2BB7E|nr:LysM peptidoglycan-binding domain-containing protein [Desulfopila sp. IMCC35008]
MLITPPQHNCKTLLILLACFTMFIGTVATGSKAANEFPIYPEIKANVAFWENIYSHYSENQAVIHDRDDLAKVYTVLNLIDHELPGAERLNKAYLKAAENKYKTILSNLAKGKTASTVEEKFVASLYPGRDRLKKMKRASTAVRSQTGLKERFIEGVIRSGAHMGRLKWIFSNHGLPQDLAYLPHVESSFNSGAYSKFGAAGMWQFTRATGKQYMTIDEAVDERLDPYISGESAAQYLKNSYQKLGNWPMALTAYNYGISGMMRARKELGSYQKIFIKYNRGHFGFASRNFYSEFLAAVIVARKLEKDPTIRRNSSLKFREIRLPGYISMAHIINHFKVAKDEVQTLNPALKKAIYNGQKLIPAGYKLRLPDTPSIISLARTIPKSAVHSGQKRDPVYQVKNGDTAGSIAIKQGVTLTQLIAANSLDRNATIYIGQRLRIPNRGEKTSSKAKIEYLQVVEKKQYPSKGSSTPQVSDNTARPIPVLTANKKGNPPKKLTIAAKKGGKRDKITVQPEESLSLYAYWLKIPEKKLRKVNSLNNFSQIHPGQQMTVLYDNVSAATFAEQRAEFLRENEMDFFAAYEVVKFQPYLVVNGDTLWDLCNNEFNIPLWLLKKYNSELNYAALHKGQQLTVPVVRAL